MSTAIWQPDRATRETPKLVPFPVAEAEPDLPALGAELERALGPRYTVMEPLAVGGMATIFKLEQTAHGGYFVAKLLHAHLAHRPGVIAAFRREACHAAQLGGHPNAVPIFDTGDVRGVPFITMPWVEGEDLDHLLEQTGPLRRDEVLQMAAQVSSLLTYAESLGITHCDLAPGNIRLDIFGRYRVLDFGISHSMRTGGNTDFIAGTPLYTSPEQVRGEAPDIRADIYALGCILCEALTGRPLFTAPTVEGLREQHLAGEWQLPDLARGDRALERLLPSMLATAREERMASAFELSGALAAMGFERPEFQVRSELRRAPKPAAVQTPRRVRLSR